MTIRIFTAGILCAALSLSAPWADASPLQQPDPNTESASSCDQRAVVARILEEGRHASTLRQRRLIHQELMESIHSPECSATASTQPSQSAPIPADTPAPADASLNGVRAADHLNELAKQSGAAGMSDGVSSYPGSAGGTSNGDLSAAERGEPVGAGGTRGGSMSPFALASR